MILCTFGDCVKTIHAKGLCREHYHSKWRRENVDRKRAHYLENRDRQRDQALQRRYGITLGKYKDLLAAQDGGCAICENSDDLVVDHCHETGEVRTILCRRCNTAIGFLRDDPVLAERVADYLVAFGRL